MKGINKIPSLKTLSKTYAKLRRSNLNCKELVLFSQWCRFDARLSELWLDYFARNFTFINPIEFNQELKKAAWPAAAMALLEFLPSQVANKNKALARTLLDVYSLDIQPAPFEIYYFEMAQMKPHWQLEEIKANLKPFAKWGYFSKEAPVNKFQLKNKTVTYKKASDRQQVLAELIQKNKVITVDLYLQALNNSVSRRISQMDLQKHSQLQVSGQTRSRVYRLKK